MYMQISKFLKKIQTKSFETKKMISSHYKKAMDTSTIVVVEY